MMKHQGLCLGTLILCCWVVSVASQHTGNETDRLSLLEFKAKINGDPLGLLSSWNDSVHFCSWPGVTCSGRHRQRVTTLDVSNWQLSGQLSPLVGNLSFLDTLVLANNSFTLEIPPEIGRLSRLRVLNFENNSFSGAIPANVSGCSNLRFLSLILNRLTGAIPGDIGSLSKLRILQLGGNGLRGEIPAYIGNLSSLSRLHLWENQLQGTIPDSLSRLKSLMVLSVGINNLTGLIPVSLYNISTIEVLTVGLNQLEGTIPHNVGLTLPNLQYFHFLGNKFSGMIPATISNASNLILFAVSSNNLFGNIPSFARLSKLEHLGVDKNNLGYAKNGDLDFLRDIANCTNLLYLYIMVNNLGGVIPETISNVTRLNTMAFGSNQISGSIPTGIGNLINVEVLGLDENRLTGHIPTTIGKLEKMNFLTLYDNQLSGTIPTALQNLTMLSKLALDNNNFQGSIPPNLEKCKNLQGLSLASNNLSGHIPSQLFSLTSLTLGLDLSSNQLSGSIPIEVGKLVNLGSLDISENKLSGEIPKSLGRCITLEYLLLQGNFLQGAIPDELDTLRGVRVLDLSRNNLSGRIPMYFEKFQGSPYLNFSFNDFEGQVPYRGVFQNTSQFSVSGNPKLCGGLLELKLRACASKVSKKRAISRRKKLAIIVSCSAVGFILFACLLTLILRSKKRNNSTLESLTGVSLPRISFGDLSKATDGFSSINLIGVGSFGSVYKGTLYESNTLVAVKVFNLQVSRALKSFEVECESLRAIKHRNLVKLVTVCSSIDFHGKDFKALVYKFMENGNLDEWLHSRHAGPEQDKCLNLIQRINIAIDVASALDYLHNHCLEPIVHCDIKPCNILLDEEMVAHVGDFGLAKLLGSVCSSSSVDQTSCVGVRGTVGYIAPEYAVESSEASTLGDIYSFGILLLEMFTGKRPTDVMFKDDFNLSKFASLALSGHVDEIVDPMFFKKEQDINTSHCLVNHDENVQKSLVSIIEIGVACSSYNPRARRNIGDVANELHQIRNILNALKTPKFRITNA